MYEAVLADFDDGMKILNKLEDKNSKKIYMEIEKLRKILWLYLFNNVTLISFLYIKIHLIVTLF